MPSYLCTLIIHPNYIFILCLKMLYYFMMQHSASTSAIFPTHWKTNYTLDNLPASLGEVYKAVLDTV